MIERSALAALNHLLEQQPWAAERLRPFAGQAVEFRCPPFPDLRLRITGNGLLERAQAETAGSLVVKLNPGTLPLLLARDETARKHVEIEGSADLAGTVDYLFSHLIWDFEEDLSRVFGDVVAHRLASGGKAVAAWQRDAALRGWRNASSNCRIPATSAEGAAPFRVATANSGKLAASPRGLALPCFASPRFSG